MTNKQDKAFFRIILTYTIVFITGLSLILIKGYQIEQQNIELINQILELKNLEDQINQIQQENNTLRNDLKKLDSLRQVQDNIIRSINKALLPQESIPQDSTLQETVQEASQEKQQDDGRQNE